MRTLRVSARFAFVVAYIYSACLAEGHANKMPIPRLRTSTGSVPGQAPQGCASPTPSAASTNSRTKLSHCAVERRYRTNIRQHLKNLRDIVPALRVLELKPGNRISNLSLKPGTRRVGVDAEPGEEGEDVVDERGYIDGVIEPKETRLLIRKSIAQLRDKELQRVPRRTYLMPM